MRASSVVLAFICYSQYSSAQILKVNPGTDLTVLENTLFTVDSLTFSPTQAFVISNTSLFKSSTLLHPSFNPNIAQVYQFTNSPTPFSGSMIFRYSDAHLNGIDENNLTLNIHNSVFWSAHDPASRNTSVNTVLTTGLSTIRLNEITLGDLENPLLPGVIVLGNPVRNNQLTIQVNQPSLLEIFSDIGSLMYKKYVLPGIQTIDVSRFARAIYFIRSNRFVQKFLVH
jgi:hypothetical protein